MKSRYIHLLRAMERGDVLYLPERTRRLDRQIVAAVGREAGKCQTANFVAIQTDPETAHRVVRVTMLEAMHRRR